MRRRARQSNPAHQYPSYGLDLSFYAPSWQTHRAVSRMMEHIDKCSGAAPRCTQANIAGGSPSEDVACGVPAPNRPNGVEEPTPDLFSSVQK